MNVRFCKFALPVIVLFLLCLGTCLSLAAAKPAAKEDAVVPGELKAWYECLSPEWGGHFRVMGKASFVSDDSYYKLVGAGTYWDGSAEARIKNKLYFGNWGVFQTHYENMVYGGDTRKHQSKLNAIFPGLDPQRGEADPVNDEHRLMDLTWTIKEGNDLVWYQRIDRFNLAFTPSWGTITLGRQAVTWGDGLLFNVMDLANPFSPTDVRRDYKIGDDMAYVDAPLYSINGGVQAIYVPRRNLANDDVEWGQSTLAARLSAGWGEYIIKMMAAHNYDDFVAGLGLSGYLGAAAWRVDAAYTWISNNLTYKSGYFSMVANMDYSWMWWARNFYGFVEFYHSGIGNNDYTCALLNPDIMARIRRNDLFVLGRNYIALRVRAELSPLFNAYITVINNLADPSGTLQPRCVWDPFQNLRLTFGANLYYGGRNTEYGGFPLPGSSWLVEPASSIYAWSTYFF